MVSERTFYRIEVADTLAPNGRSYRRTFRCCEDEESDEALRRAGCRIMEDSLSTRPLNSHLEIAKEIVEATPLNGSPNNGIQITQTIERRDGSVTSCSYSYFEPAYQKRTITGTDGRNNG